MLPPSAPPLPLLRALQSFDNKVRREAEAELERTIGRDAFATLRSLVQIGANSSFSTTDREYALTCVRCKFRDFRKVQKKKKLGPRRVLSDQQCLEMKSIMVALLSTEEPQVQQRAAEMVAAYCLYLLAIGSGWPELPQVILSMLLTSNQNFQRAGASIISSLANAEDSIRDKILGSILELIETCFFDATKFSRISFASRTELFDAVVLLLLEETKSNPQFVRITKLFGCVWSLVKGALEYGEGEIVTKILSQISTVVQGRYKVVKQQLLDGYMSIADIAISESIPDSIRRSALSLFMAYNRIFRKEFNQYVTKEMAMQILYLICKWMADFPDDPRWEQRSDEISYKFVQPLIDADNDRECEDATSDIIKSIGTNDTDYHVGIAEKAADDFAMSLGRDTVDPLLKKLIPQLIISPEWKARHVACIIISLMAEGMYKDPTLENVEMNIEPYVKWIASLYLDSNPRVRWAVAQSFGLLCTDYAPTIQNRCHEVVIQVLHTLLKDNVDRIKSHAAAALINFYNTDSVVVLKYHEKTIELLVELMKSSDISCQKRAVNCLTAIAKLCGSVFAKYYNTFVPLMLNQMEMILNGKIEDKPTSQNSKSFLQYLLESITVIGYAVGPEVFKEDGIKLLNMLIYYKVLDVSGNDQSKFSASASDFLKNVKLVLYVLKGYLNLDQVLQIMNLSLTSISKLIIEANTNHYEEDSCKNSEDDENPYYNDDNNEDDIDFDGMNKYFTSQISFIDEISMHFSIIKTIIKNTPEVLFFFGEELLKLFNLCICGSNDMDKITDILEVNCDVMEDVCECASCVAYSLNKNCFNEQGPNGKVLDRNSYFTFLIKRVSNVLLNGICEFRSEYETLQKMIENISVTYYYALKWSVILNNSKTQEEKFNIILSTCSEMLEPTMKAINGAEEDIIEIVEDKEDEYSEDYTEDTRMSYIDLVKEIARYIIGEGFSSLGDFFVPVFNKYIRNMIDRWMKVRRDAKN